MMVDHRIKAAMGAVSNCKWLTTTNLCDLYVTSVIISLLQQGVRYVI